MKICKSCKHWDELDVLSDCASSGYRICNYAEYKWDWYKSDAERGAFSDGNIKDGAPSMLVMDVEHYHAQLFTHESHLCSKYQVKEDTQS